ncbi:MAG TPA: VOC family protein [Baekduia sp.]|nr:VOC family protein [Baekduia sp.]
MPRRTSYTPSTPCWVDVFVPDTEAAKRFYGDVFGWTATPEAADGYATFQLDGATVAGLGRLSAEMAAAGRPPSWSMYVRVEDVDATVARATEIGATLATPTFDVEGVARLAPIHDPQGAILVLFEPRGFAGAEVVNEPGAWAFDDLQTPDPAAAAPFYEALFGWQIAEPPGAEGAYFSIVHQGRNIGGLMKAQRPIPQPFWTVYIGTTDADATLERVAAAGGTVLMDPTAVPAGRFAVVLDDQGATLCLVEAEFDD